MQARKAPEPAPLAQRALDIVLAIDRVRDLAPGPDAMLSGIAHLMLDHFQADLCLLYLLNQETGELSLKVLHEREQRWAHLRHALPHELIERAMQTESVQLWSAQDVPALAGLPDIPPDLHLALVPIMMEQDPLGALVLLRADPPLAPDDVALLRTAESQIDSAIIQVYTYHELEQRNRELETIYRFDRIRDQGLPFDEMLDLVLQELCAVVEAEMGFVMLYNHAGERLEMRAITHDDLHDPDYYDVVNRASNEAVRRGELLCCCGDDANTHCALMCVPLILREEIIGVFGAVNRDEHRRFTKAHQRLLKAIVSQMDTAILESLERRHLRRVLGRSLDPQVLERLLASTGDNILQGERMVVTVLYADLRGSTALSTGVAPELLVAFINDFLGQMTDVVLAHKGTLDKFIGDEAMALFGAPLPQPDHALRAVRVGLAMQSAMQATMDVWRSRGIGEVGLGVGIATGELTVGEFGCERRTDYTVIGPAANLGARICAVAEPGQVLISAETFALVQEQIVATPIPGQRFKGIDHPVTVYDVTRIL